RSYIDITKDAKFTDDAFVTVHYDYYSGQARTDDVDPDLFDTTLYPPAGLYPDGYVGNPYWSPTAYWGPIMGNGGATLLQWSKGEYFNADNIQDDLAIISSPQNGFGYRTDDHADTIASADPL